MILAVDIGNTDAVFGLYARGAWCDIHRFSTRPDLAAHIPSIVEFVAGDASAIDCVGVASVVPAVDVTVLSALQNATGTEPFVITHENAGIAIRYPHPEEVGADRLANVAGALAVKKPPLIILDFGTATTFDYVDRDSAYWGGPIAPGIHLARQALSQAAEKLPSVAFAPIDRLLPQTTAEAMQGGLFVGTIGAVNAIVDQMIVETQSQQPALVATGGLAPVIVPHLARACIVCPHLTLDGIRAIVSA